jgi:signal transduction histidine kinase
MRRGRSIKRQLFAMLAVALVALVGLYVFALVSVIRPVLELRVDGIADRDVRNPGTAAVAALQAERKAAELYLAGGRADATELQAARKTSDVAVARLRRLLAGSELRSGDDLTASKINDTIKALDALPAGRQAVDVSPDRAAARAVYTNTVWSVFALFDALPVSVTTEIATEQSGRTAVYRVEDQLSEEDAIIAGLNVTRRYTSSDAVGLSALVGGAANQVAQGAVLLSGELKSEVDKLLANPVSQRVYAGNLTILSKGFNGGVPPIDVASWQAFYHPALAQMQSFIETINRDVDKDIRNAANTAFLNLALTGLGGLLAVALSLFLAIRLGRSLAVRLAGLRASALELADVRLPDVVGRLRRGERVDAAVEAPPLNLGVDEIGQVAEAFNRVRRTAIESAVEEANLRQGINQFFVNIARRSQGLLHRQLALLDKMERRTTEPEELENLFRVDHLATRMRRHAEDLVILAGNAAGRGWRQPVPMIDVIRGAISEVEDYARVNLTVMGEEALVGRAVGDVAHLLAELIENGTNYSPPHTHVSVTGEAVGNGFAVEIEDRGLGMSADTLAITNRQLLDPPDFNPANSARLGLFVVARLAAKHGIRVQLRPSLFGGITAIVLIPTELMATPDQPYQGQPKVVRAAVTQQLPEAEARHLADDGRNVAGRADTGGDAKPDRHDGFDWLRHNTTALPRHEARSGLASSADHPTSPAPSAAAAPLHGAESDTTPTVGMSAPATAAATGTNPVPHRKRPLPRRIRQASLAPQLKDAAAPSLDVSADLASTTASPELIRARMAAFQTGTRRGRRAGEALTRQEEIQ